MGSGFCPILSPRERGDGARWAPPMAVDCHALCLPQTRASGKQKTSVTWLPKNELIIDYSVLDIYYPYPLLIILAFGGIIISTDPE